MNDCSVCALLDWEPSFTRPDASFELVGSTRGPDGMMELYRCTRCGTKWRRLVPSLGKVTDHFWERERANGAA